MPYKPRLIANAFLVKARDDRRELSHFQLQKLVYFAHAWHLAIHKEPLIDETVKVWPNGPTIDSIYHELKAHGSRKIEMMEELNFDTGKFAAMAPNTKDENSWHIVQQVWDRYGAFTPLQLSGLAHEKNSPWDVAKKLGWREIDDEALGLHYRALLAPSKSPKP